MRRLGLIAVVLGAMVLGVHGQVAAVRPLLGAAPGGVLAATADLATLLALNEALSGRSVSVRRWAWSVILLAGGQSIGLNVWYAVSTARLPWPVSVAIGAGPVILAGLLSHLLALSMGTESESGDPNPAPVPVSPTPQRPTSGTGTTGTRVPAAPPATVPSITEVPARPSAPKRTDRVGSTDVAVPADLVARARTVDAQHRAQHGRPAPARVLRTELRVRQDTSLELRRALNAGNTTPETTTATPPRTESGTASSDRQGLHLVPEPAGTGTDGLIGDTGTAKETTQ